MTQRNPIAKVELGFDEQRLEKLIATIREKPETGKTFVRARTSWVGGFKSQSHIRDFTVSMDEPRPFGGSNTAPAPVEMVLGAYGSCLTTGYVMNAGLQGIKLESVEIELEGDVDLRGFLALSQEAWPGCTEIRVKVRVKAPEASPEQLQKLHDKVMNTSPVGCIISRPVSIQAELA